MTDKGRQWSSRWGYAAILLTALAVRLCFLWGTPDRCWPHCTLLEGDAPLYAKWAQAIHDDAAFEFDLPVHSPGMAYLLAPAMGWTSPHRFLLLKSVMAAIGSVSCVVIAKIASDAFDRTIGFMAGLLSAASFGLVVQSASLTSETPYTLLLLVSLWLAQRFVKTSSPWTGAALGAVSGLAALFRAEHLVFFVILVAYLMGVWRRRGPNLIAGRSDVRSTATALGRAAIVVAGLFLVTLPWNIRSYRALQRFNTQVAHSFEIDEPGVKWSEGARHYIASLPAFAREGNVRRINFIARRRGVTPISREFVRTWFETEVGYVPKPLSPIVMISQQGALSFALANHADADGGFSTGLLDTVMGARPPDGHVSVNDFAFANPRHLRLYQEGYWIGWDYLRSHPKAAAALLWKKLTIFVAGLTSGFGPTNAPLGGAGTRRPVDQLVVTWESLASRPWAVLAWRLLIVTCVLAGLYECVKRRTGGLLALVLAYKLAIALAFYGYAREAVSILPVAYVFAALGLQKSVARRMQLWNITSPRWGKLLAPAAMIVLVLASLSAGSRGWAYQMIGTGDPAPQWGQGAFESHQRLEIQRISPNQKSSTGYRVG